MPPPTAAVPHRQAPTPGLKAAALPERCNCRTPKLPALTVPRASRCTTTGMSNSTKNCTHTCVFCTVCTVSASLCNNKNVRQEEDELNLRHLQHRTWTAGTCRGRTGTPQESPQKHTPVPAVPCGAPETACRPAEAESQLQNESLHPPPPQTRTPTPSPARPPRAPWSRHKPPESMDEVRTQFRPRVRTQPRAFLDFEEKREKTL